MIHLDDLNKKYFTNDVPQVDSSCLETPFQNFAQHLELAALLLFWMDGDDRF